MDVVIACSQVRLQPKGVRLAGRGALLLSPVTLVENYTSGTTSVQTCWSGRSERRLSGRPS